MLGRADVGLLTMSEMADQAKRISHTVSPLPVIADADTGSGNPSNVIRTVQEYESAGVAGIHSKNQQAPKKCGHMSGKVVIPGLEMVSKIKAAIDARKNPDFVLIARTDARAMEGLESALDRAKSYRDAGADALFIGAPESLEEIELVANTFSDIPLVYNWAEGGKTPPLSYSQIQSLGFDMVFFPIRMLLGATFAMRNILSAIRQNGTPIGAMDKMVPFEDFLSFIGLDEVRALEEVYRVSESDN